MSMAVAAPAQRAPTTSTSKRSVACIMQLPFSGRRAGGMGEMCQDVLGQRFGIGPDAVEESGPPRAHEAQAERIEARRRRDPAPMADLAVRIEDRHLQPAVVAGEAG